MLPTMPMGASPRLEAVLRAGHMQRVNAMRTGADGDDDNAVPKLTGVEAANALKPKRANTLPSGKLKAVVQGVGTQVIFIALVLIAYRPELTETLSPIPWWTMFIITVITFGSFVDYFQGNYAILRAAWSDEPVEGR